MSYLNPSRADVRRHRLLVGGASVVATLVIGAAFLVGRPANYMRPDPIIIYADSWAGDRSRDDALALRAREDADLKVRLAASRAYIATLPPDKRKLAQAEYDRFLAAPRKDRVS